MDKFTTLLQVVLALLGLDVGAHTLVHRIDDGSAGFHSRTHVEAGFARFDCLRSTSGLCHYVLYPRECAQATPEDPRHRRCTDAPLQHFSVATGDSRRLVALADFRLCAGPDRDPAGCQTF